MDVIALLFGVVIIGILWGFVSYQNAKLDLLVKSIMFSSNLFLVGFYAKENA